MTIRPDDRLLDAPMRPLACRRCGAEVEVRKASWHQTSVQWNGPALAACQERRAAGTGLFSGCAALRESIVQAALDGEIPVPEEQ